MPHSTTNVARHRRAVQHFVEEDTAGFSNHRRLTCYPCQVTIIRQPYMNDERWRNELLKFKRKHGAVVHKTSA